MSATIGQETRCNESDRCTGKYGNPSPPSQILGGRVWSIFVRTRRHEGKDGTIPRLVLGRSKGKEVRGKLCVSGMSSLSEDNQQQWCCGFCHPQNDAWGNLLPHSHTKPEVRSGAGAVASGQPENVLDVLGTTPHLGELTSHAAPPPVKGQWVAQPTIPMYAQSTQKNCIKRE